MRKALKYSVRTMFYASVLFLVVVIPQALALSLGAPAYI